MKRKDKLSFFKMDLLKIRYFMIIIISGFSPDLMGQLEMNFDYNPKLEEIWRGDLLNFKINEDKQLQLNAAVSGESLIYTKYKVPGDSVLFECYFKLKFAPSNENFSKIYLFTDNPDETVANGYFLRIGQSGSNDALQLYKVANGTSKLMGSGSMGAVSADPAEARIRMEMYKDGFIKVSTDYNENMMFFEDIAILDQELALQDSMYFGIYCKYTSTRTDKFYFDDIRISGIEKDTIAPSLVSVEAVDNKRLKLLFSESLNENSVRSRDNYIVDNDLGVPENIIFSTGAPNMVTLDFKNDILSTKVYKIITKEIKDLSDNFMTSSREFIYAAKPLAGDLTLSEILTDPYSNGEDFIEIYNCSEKYLKIDGLIIRNSQKNESKKIVTDVVLKPGKYAAISKDTGFLKLTYRPAADAGFIAATLPSFNVDRANITLISSDGIVETVLDSFDYDQSFHFALLKSTKGVSLERIDLKSLVNDENNWHSAAQQVLFATPGYINSNNVSGNVSVERGILPDKKVFSPNGDNIDDFLLLQYKMEKPGYLATIKIFDTDGIPVLTLINNYLLGTDGAVKWEGTDNEGNIIGIGMYIIMSRLFHPDGDILEEKSVVAVGNKF